MNLLQGAAALVALGLEIEKRKHEALEQGCVIVETEAKRVIGTDGYGWPALALSTIARKTQPGMLLETGEMRDSIEHRVQGSSGFVGSNSDIAVFNEMGTSKMPPRSFLGGAATHKGQEVASKIGEVLFSGVGAMSKALP